MIFPLALVIVCLTAWLALRPGSSTPGLGDRVAEAAFPAVACVAIVSVVYAALSLRWAGVDLSEATLTELRAIEAAIPGWATRVSEVLPKWYHNAALAAVALGVAVYRSRASPSVAAGLDRQRRVIARLRSAGNLATGLSCGLLAASSLTFFGDGIADQAGDVRAEIHDAELRFQAGVDEMVRVVASEAVSQTVAALRDHQPPGGNGWIATRDALRDMRSRFEPWRPPPRPIVRFSWPEDSLLLPRRPVIRLPDLPAVRRPAPAASLRTRLPALELLADLQDLDSERRTSSLAESVRSAAAPPDGVTNDALSSLRGTLSRNSLRQVSAAADKPATERHELVKELIAGATDQLKQAAGSDPLIVLFGEAVTPMLNEVLARIVSRGVFEPMLERWWRNAGAPAAREVVVDEVKAGVARVDVGAHRQRVADIAGRIIGAARPPQSDQATGPAQPFTVDERRRLVRTLTRLGRPDLADRIDVVRADLDDQAQIDDALRAASEAALSRGILSHQTMRPAEPPSLGALGRPDMGAGFPWAQKRTGPLLNPYLRGQPLGAPARGGQVRPPGPRPPPRPPHR